ncbi:hypothetical protein ACV35P_33095, partial [Pseudomonas aeruginosa]
HFLAQLQVQRRQRLIEQQHLAPAGQKQRIAVARPLASRPQVLPLEETLAALDLNVRKEMHIELKQMQHKLSLIHIHEPTRLSMYTHADFCLKNNIPRHLYSPKTRLFIITPHTVPWIH